MMSFVVHQDVTHGSQLQFGGLAQQELIVCELVVILIKGAGTGAWLALCVAASLAAPLCVAASSLTATRSPLRFDSARLTIIFTSERWEKKICLKNFCKGVLQCEKKLSGWRVATANQSRCYILVRMRRPEEEFKHMTIV